MLLLVLGQMEDLVHRGDQALGLDTGKPIYTSNYLLSKIVLADFQSKSCGFLVAFLIKIKFFITS